MFVIRDDGGLNQLKAEQFAKEVDFQKLLESYPELLSGELIDSEQPRVWILVAREFGIPGEADGANIWSADHLFLDQDGIPTIVEVKRQTNTELRRRIVGQMLDYASHGAVYWTVDALKARFEATCLESNKEPEQELRDRFGPETDPTRYWSQVKTNLEAQRLRLLFVADVIPRELRRVVEFLNRQMNPVEVLALELKRYGGDGLHTLSPTLFGQTEDARGAKSTASTKTWDETSFFAELEIKAGEKSVKVARRIYDWLIANLDHPIWGHGKVDGSITGYWKVNGFKLYPLMLSTQNKVYINFGDCLKPPFDQDAMRQQWLDKINLIPNVTLSKDVISKYPAIPLPVLVSDAAIAAFLSAMDWFIATVKARK